jgi:hypothetical protein
MWLAQFIFLVVFFVAGAALMPTPTTDSIARKRGIEESNRRKRETIRRAIEEFGIENPMYAQLYRVSIGTFFLGAVLVLLFNITGPNGGLSTVATFVVGLGYVVQTLSLCVFLVCAVKKRQYVVSKLRAKGIDKNPG